MECLWRQHNFIIKNHSDIAAAARAEVESAIKLFKETTGEDALGLHAFAEDEEQQVVEDVPVLLDWDDVRQLALKRCGNLNNLHRRYVTGKIQTE
jgi:hypothetical protein